MQSCVLALHTDFYTCTARNTLPEEKLRKFRFLVAKPYGDPCIFLCKSVGFFVTIHVGNWCQRFYPVTDKYLP